jgi:hypothetical protein
MLLAHTGVAGPPDEEAEQSKGALELVTANVPRPSREALETSGPAGIEHALAAVATPVAHPRPQPEAALNVGRGDPRVAFA